MMTYASSRQLVPNDGIEFHKVIPDPESPHVYIIDDDQDIRESTSYLMSSLGISCEMFVNGKAFLAARHSRPGCVLLDVAMRGMSGHQVQAELERRDVQWPVVFMSGSSALPDVVEAMKRGAVDFLEKPFPEETLLASLHRAFVWLRASEEGPLTPVGI